MTYSTSPPPISFSDPMIKLKALTKTFPSPSERHGNATSTPVLDHLDWEIPEGATLLLSGESGSGKTTLLHLIAGLETPSSGNIWVGEKKLNALSEVERAHFRRDWVGIIFQNFYLEGRLSAWENVALPLALSGASHKQTRKQSYEALETLEMGTFADQPVNTLSGGQRQRVAIARALVKCPRILLADEPTANLDEQTARLTLETLVQRQRQEKATMILVSHDPIAFEQKHWLRARLETGKLWAFP